ncbi:sensor histidine kinase [Desulfitobacterium hafniense]|nr:hypothetical protein [Desulfitobacterium hafniense]
MMRISALLASQEKQAPQEVPLIFAKMLQAEGCAVYMLKEGEYALQQAYSTVSFYQTWRQYSKDVPFSVQYLNEPEKIASLLGQKTWTRVLVLPLPGDDGLSGFLLVYWTSGSPLDGPAPEKHALWQPIAGQLAVLYYWQPMVEQLREREESLTALFQKTDDDWEESRKQISRGLYYDVGQALTAVMLQIKLLQGSDDLEYVQGRLGGLQHIVAQTAEEVLRISRSQRPLLLDKLGLPAALAALVQACIETTKIRVELNCPELAERLPEQVETIVFRSVQEALTNMTGQAGAGAVAVNLSVKGNNLFLRISGSGYGAKEHRGLEKGLLGVEERVKQAKGKFWVFHQKGQDPSSNSLTLNIVLPLS